MGSTRAAVLLAVVLLFAQASCHDVPEPGDAFVAAEESLPSVESVAIEESPLDQILLDTIARHAFPPGVNIDDALQRAVDTNQTDVILSIAEGFLFGGRWERNVTLSFEWFSALAKLRNATGFSYLATMHSLGIGTAIDQGKALLYHTLAAAGGSHRSQVALGYRYNSGIGVQLNCDTAALFYMPAAQHVARAFKRAGSNALFKIRLSSEDGIGSMVNSKQDIVQYHVYIASRGDAKSLVLLGQLHLQGSLGLERNPAKAAAYFRSAVDLGSGNAAGHLGFMYLEGEGVEANNETAFSYFERGSTALNPLSVNGKGLAYLHGYGVPRDAAKAQACFESAAEAGNADAQNNLGEMYFAGEVGEPDYASAIKYFTMAAASGHLLAQYNLAKMYLSAIGVRRQCVLGAGWLKLVVERGEWERLIDEAYEDVAAQRYDDAFVKYLVASETGCETAQSNAAYLLDNALVTLPEGFAMSGDRLAYMLYIRAANQGHVPARVKVGDFVYNGRGVSKPDPVAAAAIYHVADMEHSPEAMFNLGYMHAHSIGVDKDFFLAKRFYDKALAATADAKLPVTFAMWELYALMTFESLEHTWSHIDELAAEQWRAIVEGDLSPRTVYWLGIAACFFAGIAFSIIQGRRLAGRRTRQQGSRTEPPDQQQPPQPPPPPQPQPQPPQQPPQPPHQERLLP